MSLGYAFSARLRGASERELDLHRLLPNGPAIVVVVRCRYSVPSLVTVV
jgi:hypothetical protein